ncbi:MAG: thioredoxin family protein [Verrucomicrobia bacterium]|nr:thioredoxin family protein [Verrucomicrobiota bacterium]
MKMLNVLVVSAIAAIAISCSHGFALSGDASPPIEAQFQIENPSDYDAAFAKAKEEGKLVLLDFTGSDWCPWCIKLENEIFQTDEFKAYAKQNLVLVKVDFPRRKAQSEGLKAKNRELMRKYDVEGFPTVVVLNSEAEGLGRLGYMRNGPETFITALKSLTKGS